LNVVRRHIRERLGLDTLEPLDPRAVNRHGVWWPAGKARGIVSLIGQRPTV
jgi:hypothetical protein